MAKQPVTPPQKCVAWRKQPHMATHTHTVYILMEATQHPQGENLIASLRTLKAVMVTALSSNDATGTFQLEHINSVIPARSEEHGQRQIVIKAKIKNETIITQADGCGGMWRF